MDIIFLVAMFLLPFENFWFAPSYGWASITPIILFIYLLCNFSYFNILIKKHYKLLIIALILSFFSIINYLIGNFAFSNMIGAMISLGLGITCFLSFEIFFIEKKHNFNDILKIIFIAYSISLVIGWIQFFCIKFNIDFIYDFFSSVSMRDYLRLNRIQFTFTEPSFIGMHLFGILLPLYLVTKNRKILYLLILFTGSALFFGSGVRIVLDIIFVFFVLMISKLLKSKYKNKYIFILLLFTLIVTSFGIAYNSNYRIKKIVNQGVYADGSLASRYFRINASIKGYETSIPNFLFGYGLGNSIIPLRSGYNDAMLEYKSTYVAEMLELGEVNFTSDSVSYCVYIRFISEFGFIAFTFFLIFLIKNTKKSLFENRWALLIIIFWLYLQFESYAFYSFWLYLIILKKYYSRNGVFKNYE